MTTRDRGRRSTILAVLAGVGLLALCVAPGSFTLSAQTPSAPRYKFDPDWPKPLPNKWKMGGITGLAVDKDDNVWVMTRPDDLRDIELLAELTPPAAECCVRPHSLIHFDKNGSVIGSFDPPDGHGLDVDSKGFVYIGLDTVKKYDPKTGKVVGEVPRAADREGGGGEDAPVPRVPGRGGPGPTGTYPQPAARPDPAARAAAAAATQAFRKKYPPTSPFIVGLIEEVRLDEQAGEIYAADSYLGGRVMVFDMNTFAFKRGWGAYGRALSEMSTDDADRRYTAGGPMPKEFSGHLTLNISNDGLVYAADRNANRIHVTTRDGKFIKEIAVVPQTGNVRPARGSAGGVAFSPDRQQRLLFISDITNNKIWFLNREDGRNLGSVGGMGENGGLFFGLHMIASDSKGNIYTGEVFNGERVQRFVPVN